MTVKEMHYDFMLKLDKVATAQKKNFNVAEIDWFLNESQDIIKKQRLFGNNPKQTGFEEDQKRIDDLSTLHVKYPAQGPVTLTEHPAFNGVKVYELPLSALTYGYEYFVKGHVNMQLPHCTTRAKMLLVQNDDFEEALLSPFLLSEENVLINFGKSSQTDGTASMYIYSRYSLLENKAYIEYIKKHRRINYGGYAYIDNVTYPITHSEFPEHMHREIVDLAVQCAASVMESSKYAQATNKLLTNE